MGRFSNLETDRATTEARANAPTGTGSADGAEARGVESSSAPPEEPAEEPAGGEKTAATPKAGEAPAWRSAYLASSSSERAPVFPRRFIETDGMDSGAAPPPTSGSPVDADEASAKADNDAPPPTAEPVQSLPDETPADQAGTSLGDADWAFFNGDFERALRLYSRVIQLDSQRIAAWIGQVYALLRRDQGGEAVAWANRALEMFPEQPSLLAVRAVAYAKNGMIKRALGASDYSMSRGSTYVSWLARGEVLLAAGKNSAIACFDKALEHEGREDDWKLHMHAGMALSDYKKYSAAIGYLQRAVAECPKCGYAWYRLGECQIRLGWRDQAVQSLDRAMQLAPNDTKFRKAYDRAKSIGPMKRVLLKLRGMRAE